MAGWAGHQVVALVLLLASLPPLACAAETAVNSTSLIRFEQRAFPGFARQTVVPATEFIGMDLEKLADGSLSFHLSGWGRADLADRSGNEGTGGGNLSHAYLNYRFPAANSGVKAGRLIVKEGVAIERIDGVSARTDLRSGFTLAVFSGTPVKAESAGNSKGGFIAGGRGSYSLKGVMELGVSGLHEGGVTLDQANGIRSDRQLLGGDIWLLPHPIFELNGHTFYNSATDGLAEHSYLVTLRPHYSLTVSGTYNEQRFKNYFAYSDIRSLFNPDDNGEQKSYGGMITWRTPFQVEVSADYRRYNRFSAGSSGTGGNSSRYGADLRMAYLYRQVRSGVSYHRSEGASGFNAYHEVRGYGMYDADRYVASLDAIVQAYDNAIFNRKEAFEVIASVGCRILSELALSGELGVARNPRLDSEIRGLLRVTYNFTYAGKGAGK